MAERIAINAEELEKLRVAAASAPENVRMTVPAGVLHELVWGYEPPRAPIDLAQRVEEIRQVAKSVQCIHELDERTCSICNPKPASLGAFVDCKSPKCKQLIVWCYTENLKRTPVDFEPNPEGKLIRIGTYNGVAQVRHLKKDEAYEGARYMSHFGTCPDAASWSRSKR